MDNSPINPHVTRVSWTTPVGAVVVSVLATVVSVLVAVLSSARAGVLFWSLVAIVFAAYTVHWLRARPRLSADPSGITVRGTLHTYRLDHGQVRVGLRSTRRLGRTGQLLELDGIDTHGEERLVLLGRFDLGAEPDEVHRQLTALRAS
ncbi:PH domain-containing protein [Sciscionella sediminilitoris]|uniref:PH domain-containing protein n=1 Tax=Sciscionella sediminilitoris TaxID=1445613 RepID=UPI0018D1D270|nr:PH domain-containing protein [Sciscionella sp. SE31]